MEREQIINVVEHLRILPREQLSKWIGQKQQKVRSVRLQEKSYSKNFYGSNQTVLREGCSADYDQHSIQGLFIAQLKNSMLNLTMKVI